MAGRQMTGHNCDHLRWTLRIQLTRAAPSVRDARQDSEKGKLRLGRVALLWGKQFENWSREY